MIKKLVYIFIPVLAVLLMSHNSYALNVNFENYSVLSTSSAPVGYCTNMDGTQYTFPCNLPPNAQQRVIVRQIRTNTNGYQLQQGDIIEFYVTLYTNANYNINGGTIGLQDFRPLNYPNIINLNVEQIQNYSFLKFVVASNPMFADSNVVSDFWANAQFFRTYKITQYVATDGTYNIGLYPNNYLIDWYATDSNNTRMSLHDLTFYHYQGSAVNKESEQKTQNAADNSVTSGSSSSSSSQTATSSLLSVITSGIGAITSASPTNCKINGNMGNLNVGNIDLCANPVPTFMAIIGSIIAVLVVLPLVILLFNRFINIIRSFQR